MATKQWAAVFLVLAVAALAPGCSSGSTAGEGDQGSGGSPGLSRNNEDFAVVDALWRLVNGVTNGASWYVVGSVDASGSCDGGTYKVSGTVDSDGNSSHINLTYRLSGCVLRAQGETLTYKGDITEVGWFAGSGASQTRNVAMSSKSLTVTGTLAGAEVQGYQGCALSALVDTSFHNSGSFCGRSFSAGASSGETSGGSGDCSAKCQSTCTGNVPEQACFYCQAACLCACSHDACEAENRSAAQALGTTCP